MCVCAFLFLCLSFYYLSVITQHNNDQYYETQHSTKIDLAEHCNVTIMLRCVLLTSGIMLRAVMLRTIMPNVIIRNTFMLNAFIHLWCFHLCWMSTYCMLVMLNVILLCANMLNWLCNECHSTESCYAECRYAECRYAECRNAECRYAECLCAILKAKLRSLQSSN